MEGEQEDDEARAAEAGVPKTISDHASEAQPEGRHSATPLTPVHDWLIVVAFALTAGWVTYCALVVRSVESSAALLGTGASIATTLALALLGYAVRKPEDPGDWLAVARSLGTWASAKAVRRWSAFGGCLAAAILSYWLGPDSVYRVRVICNGANAIHFADEAVACNVAAPFRFRTLNPKLERFICVWDSSGESRANDGILDLSRHQLQCVSSAADVIHTVDTPSPRPQSLPARAATLANSPPIPAAPSVPTDSASPNTMKDKGSAPRNRAPAPADCTRLAEQLQTLEHRKPKPCITENYPLQTELESCRVQLAENERLSRIIRENIRDQKCR